MASVAIPGVSFMSAALVVLGCSTGGKGTGAGGGDGGAPASDSKKGEQASGQCPAFPAVLTGTKSAGETCQTYAECAPVCCSCSGGSPRTWLAADCDTGHCSSDACASTAAPIVYCTGSPGCATAGSTCRVGADCCTGNCDSSSGTCQ